VQARLVGGSCECGASEIRNSDWIRSSLTTRVAAEVNLHLQTCGELAALDGMAPVVAAYTARGTRRHTVILPFTLFLAQAFRPRTQDATVYDPNWRDPRKLWDEITPTSRLITAYYLWQTFE